MINVQFSALRGVEYTDPQRYMQHVGRWLCLREAENSYILGSLPAIVAQAALPTGHQSRLFAVQDGDHVLAAAILYPNGCLVLTWATPEMKQALAQTMVRSGCKITSVFGPGHVSWYFSRLWAQYTGQDFAFDRTERVYQLARPTYPLPPTGRLELATTTDRALLTRWLTAFTHEAHYENTAVANVCESLLTQRQLYLWKDPAPVAMAAWVSPTPHGGCINFVYTPAAQRRQGHASAVVSALAHRMLNQGSRFCFIMTDPTDQRTNGLYQRLGARTLCELLRCLIVPAAAPILPPPPPRAAPATPPAPALWRGTWH